MGASPSNKNANSISGKKEPFYKKTGWIIVLLLFMPPIGMYLMFKYMDKPSRTAKIIISVVWGLWWLLCLLSASGNGTRKIEIDGQTVEMTCEMGCSEITSLGDQNALEYLAKADITYIKSVGALVNNEATATLGGSRSIVIAMNSDKKVSKIYDKDYPSIVYYSADSAVATVKYPATEEVEAIEAAEAEQKAQEEAEKKAAEEEKAREEEERKAAAARYPSADSTAELCEKKFHNDYPYSGSKVHSVLGVIANSEYNNDQRLYKVGVTIQNAYGTTYDTTMECITQKYDENMIKIVSFYIY